MSTNSISAPGAFPRSSPAPTSGLSQDGGTLELGIESAWTRDEMFATGVERSDSLRAEPPTSDQLSTNSLMGALEAPSEYNSPPVIRMESVPLETPLIVSEDSGGSAMMSISPLLESVVGQRYLRSEQPLPSTTVPIPHDHGRHSPRPSENLTWADLPNDDELGDAPEFLLLSPLIESQSVKSSPRIPYESKGKLPEPKENNVNEKLNPNEWYHDWTTSGDELPNDISINHSDPQPSTANKYLKSSTPSGGVISKLRGHTDLVSELQDRIRKLEKLVVLSQTREENARKLVMVAHRATVTRNPANGNQNSTIMVDPGQSRPSFQDPPKNGSKTIPLNSRYQRASSVLPQTSSVKRAMMGAGPLAADPVPSDSSSESSSDDDTSSTESSLSGTHHGHSSKTRRTESPVKAKRSSPRRNQLTNDFGANFLAIEPESDHDSDSAETKHCKRVARREYRTKLNLLKYQQGFIKNEPPFTYTGEANATMFKKWVREVRDWKDRARLTTSQSLRMLGKYLSGQAYRFYECNILDLQKAYSLTEFFEQLFDYVFPPDFRMQQRQKFTECHQEHKQSVRDYLRRLRTLADMAGDVDEQEMVRQFWMNCQPYIKASLVDKGYEPNTTNENGRRRDRPRQESRQERRTNQGERPRKSPETLRRLRDNNQCFECEQTGHLVKDCPQRHRLPFRPTPKVSSLQASAVGVSSVDIRNAAIEEGVASGLFGMAVCISETPELRSAKHLVIAEQTLATLRSAVPLPTDETHSSARKPVTSDRFSLTNWGGPDTYLLHDKLDNDSFIVYYHQLCDPEFDPVPWLVDLKLRNRDDLKLYPDVERPSWSSSRDECHDILDRRKTYDDSWWSEDSSNEPKDGNLTTTTTCNPSDDVVSKTSEDDYPQLLTYESTADEGSDSDTLSGFDSIEPSSNHSIYCGGSAPNLPDVRTLHQQAARPKSTTRLLPRSLVVIVLINDRPCRALLDLGSLTDFVSTTVVDQLKLRYDLLEKPIPLQLAVSGSRSIVKATTTVNLKYQDVSGPCTFDIANLETYDVILGMPFLYQHQVLLGFNPSEIKIRSLDPLPIRGSQTQVLELKGSSLQPDIIEAYREDLRKYAKDICLEAIDTPLPAVTRHQSCYSPY
ncbi:hypothetical protein DFH29DRAFT_878387 [Suillus ampliporus]|nr:hypothetical protein DFH29DRAFT_878387 [Suillus ampliporus]